MPDPLLGVRVRALVEAKRFLYQHPMNASVIDPVELLREVVREYEAHLPLATRELAKNLANGDAPTAHSVSPSV